MENEIKQTTNLIVKDEWQEIVRLDIDRSYFIFAEDRQEHLDQEQNEESKLSMDLNIDQIKTIKKIADDYIQSMMKDMMRF